MSRRDDLPIEGEVRRAERKCSIDAAGENTARQLRIRISDGDGNQRRIGAQVAQRVNQIRETISDAHSEDDGNVEAEIVGNETGLTGKCVDPSKAAPIQKRRI